MKILHKYREIIQQNNIPNTKFHSKSNYDIQFCDTEVPVTTLCMSEHEMNLHSQWQGADTAVCNMATLVVLYTTISQFCLFL